MAQPRKRRAHSNSPALTTEALEIAPGEPQRKPIDQLEFDPENPRIVERLGEKPSQQQIEYLLLTGEMKARELVPSFIENGYIPYEPLIVRPRGKSFVVVEGNRRLAALRSMQKSKDAEEQRAFHQHGLESIPCLIFRGDDRQLLAYLGLRHLSKTKDWSTSAKAAFVERVLTSGLDLREASRLTNTTTNALRLILLTRRLFDRAGDLGIDLSSSGADGETFFWHLGDAVRRTRTKAYLHLRENPQPLKTPELDETHFENLLGWLYGNSKTKQQRIIGSIRDIGKLDLCLGNERATAALENGATLDEAEEELEAAGATIAGHLERAKRSLQRATSNLSDLEAQGISQVEDARGQLAAALEQFGASFDHRRQTIKKRMVST